MDRNKRRILPVLILNQNKDHAFRLVHTIEDAERPEATMKDAEELARIISEATVGWEMDVLHEALHHVAKKLCNYTEMIFGAVQEAKDAGKINEITNIKPYDEFGLPTIEDVLKELSVSGHYDTATGEFYDKDGNPEPISDEPVVDSSITEEAKLMDGHANVYHFPTSKN